MVTEILTKVGVRPRGGREPQEEHQGYGRRNVDISKQHYMTTLYTMVFRSSVAKM